LYAIVFIKCFKLTINYGVLPVYLKASKNMIGSVNDCSVYGYDDISSRVKLDSHRKVIRNMAI
jgi:hypothetical protein